MKVQWSLIFALIFALLVAIFAVVNVDPVPVNYVFGVAESPLILVIIGSALVGGLIVGLFGIIRQYRLQRKINQLQKQLPADQPLAHDEKPASPMEEPSPSADEPEDKPNDTNPKV
jgi:putative membrane protein